MHPVAGSLLRRQPFNVRGLPENALNLGSSEAAGGSGGFGAACSSMQCE